MPRQQLQRWLGAGGGREDAGEARRRSHGCLGALIFGALRLRLLHHGRREPHGAPRRLEWHMK